jgi:hypothetical protein
VQSGATPFTTPQAYALCHHLPNWIALLADLTPETCVLPPDADFTTEIARLGWGKVFVKDFVKSLKTSRGSVAETSDDVAAIIAELKHFRGTLEGGLCVRRFESFIAQSETRYFVIDGVAHGPQGKTSPLAIECAKRIASPFFSVDIALRADGVERVVEIGDGQVSDLVGWEPEAFATLWAQRP